MRTAEYRLDEIMDLVVAREDHWFDPQDLKQHYDIAGGWLCFSYRGQQVRFGKCLSWATAEEARAQVLAWKQQAVAGNLPRVPEARTENPT